MLILTSRAMLSEPSQPDEVYVPADYEFNHADWQTFAHEDDPVDPDPSCCLMFFSAVKACY